jgi:hypothetical protein
MVVVEDKDNPAGSIGKKETGEQKSSASKEHRIMLSRQATSNHV